MKNKFLKGNKFSPSPKPMLGKRFGKLIVSAEHPERKWECVQYICQCDCGNTVTVSGVSLRRTRKPTIGCGCRAKERDRTKANNPNWKGGIKTNDPAAYARVCAMARYHKVKHNRDLIEFIPELRKRQRNRCSICKKSLDSTPYDIDHIIPISRGGDHSKRNVQLVCRPCNRRKGAQDPIKFMQKQGYLL